MNAALYYEGMVKRDESTPAELIATCFAWYDGEKSAMWQFFEGKEVKPHELAKEAELAALDLTDDQISTEHNRLKALRQWATRLDRLCRAAQELREAQEQLSFAAKGAELSADESAAIREAACWGGK